jgi:hypothetical protein
LGDLLEKWIKVKKREVDKVKKRKVDRSKKLGFYILKCELNKTKQYRIKIITLISGIFEFVKK